MTKKRRTRRTTRLKAARRGRLPGHQAGVPNTVERKFAAGVLAPARLCGEVLDYVFEPMTLTLSQSTHVGRAASQKKTRTWRPDYLVVRADIEARRLLTEVREVVEQLLTGEFVLLPGQRAEMAAKVQAALEYFASDARLELVDVKGTRKDDEPRQQLGIETAAKLFPWFDFVIERQQTKGNGGGFERTEIRPR